MQTPDKRLVTEAKLAEELAAFTPGAGSGIEEVSGAVTLDGTGASIREFYTTGATTFTSNGNPTLISSFTAVVWRRDGAGVWGYKEVSSWTIPASDTTAPTAGTLASSNLLYNSVRLTVSGASDAVALHATPYRFSTNNGSAWSSWQSSNVYDVTGLSGSTSYTCKAEVRDAAGNTAQTGTVSVTTPAAPADTTPPTAGTLASSAITSTGFTLTVSGASDAIGLHATPYAFSTDNGATYSAYQSSASFTVTGKAASTGYQCKARVRDAAGNTSDTAAITVTTTAAVWTTVWSDDFTGTDNTNIAGTTTSNGAVWANAAGEVWIKSNKAVLGVSANFTSAYAPIPTTASQVRVTGSYTSTTQTGQAGVGVRVGTQFCAVLLNAGVVSGTMYVVGGTNVNGGGLNIPPASGVVKAVINGSTMDVYVNDVLHTTKTLPAGTINGAGVMLSGSDGSIDDVLVEVI